MSSEPVSLIDIYPTLAEAAGYQPPGHLEGTSLVPHLNDPAAEHDPVITSYRFPIDVDGSRLVGHSVRSERYRYVYYPAIGLEELYDHRSDPNEYDNIAYREESADIVRSHRERLLELLPDLGWGEGDPLGYRIRDGKVRRVDYRSISEIGY